MLFITGLITHLSLLRNDNNQASRRVSKGLNGITLIIFFILFLRLFLPRAANLPQATDGPEMVLASITGGLAHPPGYTLWTYLLSAVTKSATNPYLAASLFTGIVQAFAALFLMLVCTTLSRSIIIGSLCALSWSLLLPTLLTATDPEVFALNNLLTTVFLFLTLTKLSFKKQALLVGLIFGLGISHHHLMIFWLPILIWWGLSRTKNEKLEIIIGFVLGLSPWLLIFLRYANAPQDSFAPVSNFAEWLGYILRLGYGTLQLAIVDGEAVKVFSSYWTYILISCPILIVASFLSLGKLKDQMVLATLIVVGLQVWFVYQIILPREQFDLFWSYRVLSGVTIPLYVLFAIVLSKFNRVLIVSFLIVPQLFGLATFLKDTDRTRNFTAYLDVVNWMSKAKPKAVLLADSDSYAFITSYRQKIEKKRTDLFLISSGMLASKSYRNNLKRQFQGLNNENISDKAQLIIQLKALGYVVEVENS